MPLGNDNSLFARLYSQLNDHQLLSDKTTSHARAAAAHGLAGPLSFQSSGASFAYALCRFLVARTDLGRPNDIVHKIAACEKEEDLKPFLGMKKEFFECMMQGLYNDKHHFDWREEKECPRDVDSLLGMFETYLQAFPYNPKEMQRYTPSGMPQKLVWIKNMHVVFDDSPDTIKLYRTNDRAKIPAPTKTVTHDSRAKIIYLNGLDPAAETAEEIRRDVQRIRRIVAPRVLHDKYDSYVITYNNGAVLKKIQYLIRYNADPGHFASPIARAIVEKHLPALYSDAKGAKLNAEELYKQMSLVTFVGYSYGGTLIQEIRNALSEKLKTMDYPPAVVTKALSHVAAFNLSTVTRITDKSATGDFTQAFSSADGDQLAASYSNIGAYTAPDPNHVLKQYRIETPEGISLIALRGMDTPGSLLSFTTQSIDQVLPRKEDDLSLTGMHAPGNPDKKITIRVIDKSIARPDSLRHHITANYRSDGVRLIHHHEDHERQLVLRSNPAAEFTLRALRAQVQDAVLVGTGEKPERDSAAVNRHIAQKWLTPERIEKMHAQSSKLRGYLEREMELGHIKPSSPGR